MSQRSQEIASITKYRKRWARFWLECGGPTRLGRIATRIATFRTPPYYGRVFLSRLSQKGYISPKATIHHDRLKLGRNVYIDDAVLIYQDIDGGPVEFGDNVHLHRNTIIQIGRNSALTIGSDTHIQPGCLFSGYVSSIRIGSGVEIAANCAFYSYNHGTASGKAIRQQPLQTKGGIHVGDDVWIGAGVIVLDGVTVGNGAILGAGSVITHSVPNNAFALGVPARVVKMRSNLPAGAERQNRKTLSCPSV